MDSVVEMLVLSDTNKDTVAADREDDTVTTKLCVMESRAVSVISSVKEPEMESVLSSVLVKVATLDAVGGGVTVVVIEKVREALLLLVAGRVKLNLWPVFVRSPVFVGG